MIRAAPKFHLAPPFPENPRDAEGWNRFWQAVLDHQPGKTTAHGGLSLRSAFSRFWQAISASQGPSGFDIEWLRTDYSDYQYREEHIPIFDEMEHRRILCAGSGICSLPYLFFHCGFNTVAVDLSSVATHFTRDHPPNEETFVRLFTRRPLPSFDSHAWSEVRQAIRDAHRPNGTLDFLTADLFAWNPGDGSFDAAVMRHVVEHFSPADRAVLAERLYRWLAPGGILIVESQHYLSLGSGDEISDGIEEVFEAAGFLFHLKEAYRWQSQQYKLWFELPVLARADRQIEMAYEFNERAAAIGASDLEQVRQGRKLVIFRHSS